MKFYLFTKKLNAILVLLTFATFGWSQGIVYTCKNAFVGGSFSESPASGVLSLSSYVAPKKGVLTINGANFTYVANASYRGLDTFTVKYTAPANPGISINYKSYIVKLDNSFLTINQDYATTDKNQAVAINVLANDNAQGPNGAISLDVTSIALINNGLSATINAANQIVFTPSTDFVGVAYVNYVACDNLGFNCATGSAAIKVNNTPLVNASFERLTTSKNTPAVLMLSKNNFNITSNGKKGTATFLSGNAFNYVPNNGFVGKDTVSFANPSGLTSKFEIEVLNKAAINQFATDDYAYTPENQSVTIDVLKNDKALSVVVGGFTQPIASQGTVTKQGNNFVFTPAPSFRGIAKFTYLLTKSSAIPSAPINEWATVYIVVSNQYPAKSVFNLLTPKNTPLVLNYKVPITGYNFVLVDLPQHGTLNYYPGYTTLNLGPQNSVSGYNLIIYTPAQGFAGTDEYEVLYTINGNSRSVKFITEVQTVTPTLSNYCVGDCVWAGDANNDGIVDMADILPIGFCQGEAGLARSNASVNWFGQYGNNWNNPFMPGQDLKYIDTNGDGDVTSADTSAISANFLKAHNIVPEKQMNFKAVPLYMNLLTPNPQIGDYVEVDLLIGKTGVPVTDLYGFTMDIPVDPQVINEQSLTCSFYNNSWMTNNSPTLRLAKKPMDSKIYLGYVRTNGTAASGYGKVAKLGFIIDDELAGVRDNDGTYKVTLSIKNGKMMGSDGQIYDMPEQTFEFPISTKRTKTFDTNSIFVSPNPTVDVLNVQINSDEESEYSIINLNGQTVNTGKINSRSVQLNVSNLQSGMYILKVVTHNGVATKKFEKI
jgi:hypothetical protein